MPPFHHRFKSCLTGWRGPQPGWTRWLRRLLVPYATIWMEAGILDGILASLHRISPCPSLVLGLAEHWCPRTNTFLFPWGEATVTLEDVMVLTGVPVVGDEVKKLEEEKEKGLVEELRRVRRELCRGSGKKAKHGAWMKHFMDRDDEDEVQHVAFLALWLSRFVLCDSHLKGVVDNVFLIAVQLSRGRRVALGQTVLARMYGSLGTLARKGRSPSLGNVVKVSGPFWLVQVWACERLPLVRSAEIKPLWKGYPRLARWDRVRLKGSLSFVRTVIMSGEGFRWRPYAVDVENWRHLAFYGDHEQFVSPNKLGGSDEELKSFHVFLRCCELIEFHCRVSYRPNRVAMQFGYDQDIPGEPLTSYDSSRDTDVFYVPCRTFEPCISERYRKWWEGSMIARKDWTLYHEDHKMVVTTSMDAMVNNSIDAQIVKKPTLDEDLSELDHIPLGRRLRDMRIKNPRKKKLFEHSDGKDDMVVDKELLSADPSDIDHLPLKLRLKSILAGTTAGRNHSDSDDASTGDQPLCLVPGDAYKDQDMEITLQETLGSSTAKEVIPNCIEETRRIKGKASDSSNNPIDIDGSIESWRSQDRTRVGESCYYPINVDEYVERGGILRAQDELEKSVELLERSLGLGYPVQTSFSLFQ
ncbi:hypothetical protein Droror1_Dr00009365 [Drosera rotundifolia]